MPHWQLIVRLEPSGHRLFLDKKSGRLALVDNSGPDPSSADHGVLWLDRSRPVVLDLEGRNLVAHAPVIEENGTGSHVGMSPLSALSLVAAADAQGVKLGVRFNHDNPQVTALLQLTLFDPQWQRTVVASTSVTLKCGDTTDFRVG